jgi:hypothetical protein
MAESDLDIVVRQIAKKQTKSLLEATRKRRDRFVALAAKAKDKAARDRYKHLAKATMLHGTAMAKRLQISAENAADSYMRSMKKEAEQEPKKNAVKKKSV